MTLEIGFLLLVLVAMVVLFLTEKLPVDLTAFAGLVILILTRYVAPDEAFGGFASAAVITMLSVFIVSAALQYTGVADRIAGWLHALVGNSEVSLTVVVMIVAAVLSAFMNNIAATAVLMPAVASLARRRELPPSRLFMPLAFGAILGGTTTLVGTPPNILAAEMLRDRGLQPFGLFDYTPVGIVLLAVGIVYMVTLGRRSLPVRESAPAVSGSRELAQVYQLHEQLFSIRLPSDSHLAGTSLGESRIGSTLRVQVVGILRGGRTKLAPGPESVMKGGDVLLVQGRLEDLQELVRVQGIEVRETRIRELPRVARGVSAVRARIIAGSKLLGQTLKELDFRKRFGVVVIGIERGGEIVREHLSEATVREGDDILALGSRDSLDHFSQFPQFKVTATGLAAVQKLQEYLHLIRVREGSPLAGATLGSSRMGELVGLTIGGIIRDGRTHLAVPPDEIILAGDGLLIAGEPWRIVKLLEFGDVEVAADVETPSFESDDTGIVEAAIAPRSSVAGRTLAELSFRERYGLQVLGIWREGHSLRDSLPGVVLRFGDALLIQGPWDKIRLLAADADFVVLSDIARAPRRTGKAWAALAGLALMIGMVVSGFQPIHVAAFSAATLVVLAGALRMHEVYRAVEWRAIFLVAAILPFGIAFERTGAASLLAGTVTDLAGPAGPYAALATLVVVSSLFSQGLDGSPAVVLLAPVAVQIAQRLGIEPYPLMMGVGLAASAAFMTPFSHKANLLVMGAGGYRAIDYVRVGSPLTIVLLGLIVVLVPLFFPF